MARRREDRRKKKKQKASDVERGVPMFTPMYVQALGFETVDEYMTWCGAHGFKRSLEKTSRQCAREAHLRQRERVQEDLVRQSKRLRNPRHFIDAIHARSVDHGAVTTPLQARIYALFNDFEEQRLAVARLRRLLLHVESVGKLVAVTPFRDGRTWLDGLAAMAAHDAAWLRPVESWKPSSHNVRRQFASLARHLFARYDDIPLFMDNVWFEDAGEPARTHQGWYIHMGRGEGIQRTQLPLPYTRKMAHHFKHAPDDYSALEALRWGQIHALGGNERLAAAVAGTRLGRAFEHDDFWTTVLRFFIDNPMLDTAHVGPIVDFLHHQKFVPLQVLVAEHVVEEHAAPQPHLSMKGRTVEALLRQVEIWHGRLAHESTIRDQQWVPSGFTTTRFEEGKDDNGNPERIWSVRELLNSRELIEEGRTLHHCVATYASSCKQGTCSIWSLRRHDLQHGSKEKSILTIEVRNRTKVICQARGPYNAVPDPKARRLMQLWAHQAGLTVASYV